MNRIVSFFQTNNTLKIMVFFLPLFFLPFSGAIYSSDVLSKVFLLSLILPVFLLVEIIKNTKKEYFIFSLTKIDFLLLMFFLFSLASILFSVNKYNSIYGAYQFANIPFVAIYVLALFYAMLRYKIKDKQEVYSYLRYLIVLYFVSSLASFVGILFLENTFFIRYLRLALANSHDISIFLSVLTILFFSITSSKEFSREIFKNKTFLYFTRLAVFFSLIVLVSINFVYSWFVLLFGAIIIFCFRVKIYQKEKEQGNHSKRPLIFQVLLFLFALNYLLNFFIVYKDASLDNYLANYRQLDTGHTWQIVFSNLKENTFFGIGLENFDYAFSKYRPASMNNAVNWDLRYERTGSFFQDILIGGGILLGFVLLFIVFLFLQRLKKHAKSLQKNPDLFTILLSISLLLFLMFFVNFNFNLLFIFIVLIALFVSAERGDDKKFIYYKINTSNAQRVIPFLIIGFLIVLYIVFNLKMIKIVYSNFILSKTDFSQESLIQADLLEEDRYEYKLRLAKIFAKKSIESSEAGQKDLSLKYEEKSLAYISEATKYHPESILVRETAASLYRDFSSGLDGYNQLAIQEFSKAHELEPSNPVLLAELGQVFLDAGNLEKAQESFFAAVDLKPDHSISLFGKAKVLVRKNEFAEAEAILNELITTNNNPEVYYELGLLYFNNEMIDEAYKYFQIATTYNPLHSNSLFGLALILEKRGDTDQALAYLRKVQKINPNNIEIIRKIEELEQ